MIQRVIAVTVALVLVVGGGVFAYRQLIPAPEEEASGPSYATVPVRRGDISVGVTARGILQPSQGGALQVPWPRVFFGSPPPEQFTVLEVLAQEGDYVRQGDPVIRLDASQLQSSIDQVRNDLEQKRQNLADRLGISVSELGSVNPARGITLRAPIDGRVTLLTVTQDGKDVRVAPGVSVRQGTPVARIVQDTRWVMTASLVPAEFERLKVGDRVLARFAGFEGFVEATITEINPNTVPVKESELGTCRGAGLGNGGDETSSRVVQVYRARIEGDNPGLVLPGMEAQIALPNAEGEAGGSWLLYCAKVDGYAEEETVVSTSDGVITEVFARDMQQVKAGDPLVALSGEATQRAIEQDLEAIRNLEMQLEGLQSFASQLTVTAPMDGVVSELRVQPGQTINMGDWLGSIYNPGRMEMFVRVDDVDVLLIQQGAPVQITLDALPGRTFSGQVSWISPSGQDESGFTFFEVRIEVEGGPELRPGMQAQAFIDAGKAENVLLVPLEAIFQEDRQYKVEVLKEDGTTEVVPVEVGLMNEFMAEIKSGLEEGQQVVVGSSADLLPTREAPESLLPGPSGEGSGGSGGSGGPAEPGGGEGGG